MSGQMSRRAFLALAGAGSFILPGLAQSQPVYPAKQILLVVPYPAGGAVDLAARLVAEKTASRFRPVDRRREPARRQRHGGSGSRGAGTA